MSFYDFLAGLIGFGGMAKDAIETGAAMSDPMQQMIMPGDAFYIDAAGEFRFFNGRKCYEEHVMGETYLVDKKSGKRTSVNSIIHAERIRKGLEENDKNLTAIWYGCVPGPFQSMSEKTDLCITGDPDPHMWGNRFYDKETKRVLTIRTFYWIPELYCSNQKYSEYAEKYVTDENMLKVYRRLKECHHAEFFVDVKTKQLIRLSDRQLLGTKLVLKGEKYGDVCCCEFSWVPRFIEKQNKMHVNRSPEIEKDRPKYFGRSFWSSELRNRQDEWAYQDSTPTRCDDSRSRKLRYTKRPLLSDDAVYSFISNINPIKEWLIVNGNSTEITPRKYGPFRNDYAPVYERGRSISGTYSWDSDGIAF